MLILKNVTKRFGGLLAVNNVSFTVEKGEILALIGPNGAGKTTLFNLITGNLRPDGGEIFFKGRKLNGLKPFQIARLGIARTFQNLELFPTLTTAENVMVGFYRRNPTGFFRSLLRRPGTMRQELELYREATQILAQLGLAAKADWPASSLPFGQQRLLEIARALAGKPELVLLDEPAAGLNHTESEELARFLRSLVKAGHTLVLVEHDMDTVMGVADRIVVLNFGTVIATGTPKEIQRHPEVIAAYLGREEEEAC